LKLIKISIFPASKTFEKFVKYFRVEQSNYKLPILDIPEHIGEGNLLALDICNDISLIYLNGCFNDEVVLRFQNEATNSLNFIYNYKSSIHHKIEDEECWQELDQFQHAISSSYMGGAHSVKLEAKKNYSSYIISVSKSAYLSNRKKYSNTITRHLKSILDEGKSDSFFFHTGSYSLAIADILKSIFIGEYTSFEQIVYLEAKTHELINSHLVQYIRDVENKNKKVHLSSYEIKAIHTAALYIESNISKIKTVSQVAKHVGLNSNKLQHGFKGLYGTSVHNFIGNIRMNKASDLLIHSDDSISEIVLNIGLNSNSYFSKLFKEKYQISPSIFRKRIELPSD